MDWYKFNLRDYLAVTKHLPDAEDLAFRRLIDLYYFEEKPLTLDHEELIKRIGLDWECIEPILRDFFHPTPEGYVNYALEEDLQQRLARRVKNQASGAKGGRPRVAKGK